MPIINGIKFACNSCIKGHRSSHCNHVERPLFEIRRKGRPVTQCAYCRDLRKTKQVHVKCVCSERRGIVNWEDTSFFGLREF
ncbi:copper fist DNA binding domain-containing protein [Phascolomyces articulosus]|uniref:Copper fist DNA binding domain-containing protein n=2 Tax=Lichtheimiaceae TaxID=499202 RepID=A0AAD5JRE2_9FUNG|nr:copper fist DNA binding domain-containing protein [Phascolomyces articulosus]